MSSTKLTTKHTTGGNDDSQLPYLRLDQIQHVLHRPEMYIGSVKRESGPAWVYDTKRGKISSKTIEYVPAMYKVFDEIIVNAIDHCIRLETAASNITSDTTNNKVTRVKNIKVTFDRITGTISVYNDGDGISIYMADQATSLWSPEMIFGTLFTGSNFDDSKTRTIGGKNGIGAKACNIMSRRFEVDTLDIKSGLKYHQVFENNMQTKSKPKITKITSKTAKPYTQITFLLDYERFGYRMEQHALKDADVFALLLKRVFDIYAVTPSGVNISLTIIQAGKDGSSHHPPETIDIGKTIVASAGRSTARSSRFEDYIRMYTDAVWKQPLSSADDDNNMDDDITPKKKPQKSSDGINVAFATIGPPGHQWEVAVARSSIDSFQHVSFVNGVFTLRGGKHVDHIVTQVTTRLIEELMTKRKSSVMAGASIQNSTVRNKLIVFVNAKVDNPSFDSQTKDFMTTPIKDVGRGFSPPASLLPDVFLNKLSTAAMGIREALLLALEAKTARDLSKTDGKKARTLTGITKLDDANWAGGPKSTQCTLILTEGDSAKSTAIAGLAVVGRDRFGVYPLRGKLLNVKEVSAQKLLENDEINHIKRIMGLKSNKCYDNDIDFAELRYGRVMIMTDQDVDGSHIKGLIFNLFDTLWPSLLRRPGFLTSLLTPIIKVSSGPGGNKQEQFFTQLAFDQWRSRQLGKSSTTDGSHGKGLPRGTHIKYYKGLGTSTSSEAKEYFKAMRIAEYTCDAPLPKPCAPALDLAFNKKRADDRKSWLMKYDSKSSIEYLASSPRTLVSFHDFVHKDLVHFSMYDVARSIPNVVDGLKTSQRKILYACIKKAGLGPLSSPTSTSKQEMKVFQLSGYVSEVAAYHHGDASLYTTIVGMAQDFVGSNNLNILDPIGQFGTRRQGGRDAAGARYISTRIFPIMTYIFRPEDLAVLEYLSDDGYPVEPRFYVPIIPMVLVNGASGIGTGFSTNVPSYNPIRIVNALQHMLAGNNADTSIADALGKPWYRGFVGDIVEMPEGDGLRYASFGRANRSSPTTVDVTELPLGMWMETYKAFLGEMVEKQLLVTFQSHYTDVDVNFKLKFKDAATLDAYVAGTTAGTTRRSSGSTSAIHPALSDAFAQLFKLVSVGNELTTTNMHLFDREGQIKKYKNVREILSDFFEVRMSTYKLRRRYILSRLEAINTMLEAKLRFIREVINGTLVLSGKPTKTIVEYLIAKEYPPEKKTGIIDGNEAKTIDEITGNEEDQNALDGGAKYGYLLRMPLSSLTRERLQILEKDVQSNRAEIQYYMGKTPADIWTIELKELAEKLNNIKSGK